MLIVRYEKKKTNMLILNFVKREISMFPLGMNFRSIYEQM